MAGRFHLCTDDTFSLALQIINQLSWMSHSQHLRRVSREYVIDLYLRPPVTKYRLMDYMHIERIVTSANRCAWQLLCLCVLHLAGHACPGATRWAGLSPALLHPEVSACRLAVGVLLSCFDTIVP